MDAFLDRHLRQADQDHLGHPAGGVHFHLDRHGVDSDQRECLELGEHDYSSG